MVRLIALSLLFCLCACGTNPHVAPVATAPQVASDCKDAKSWQADIEQRNTDAAVEKVVELTGQDAVAFMQRFNAVPPPSDVKADQIVVLGAHSKANGAPSQVVMLGLFSNGCLVRAGRVPVQAAAELVSPGEPS